MARNDPDRHCLRVLQASYPHLTPLLNQGLLCPTRRALCGPPGQTWQVRPSVPTEALSDDRLQIGNVVVRADLSRLPTPAYRALVAGSPQFHQYPDLDQLLTQMLDPHLPAGNLAQRLEAAVALGRQPDPVPRLVVTPTTFQCTWLPAGTYLRQAGCDWFVFLSFATTYTPGQQARRKVAIGLDLGMRPLTVAVTSSGTVAEFVGHQLAHLSTFRPLGLSPVAHALYHQLRFAVGRRDAENVVRYLIYHGSAVFAEALTHRGMGGFFVHDGRDRALHDYHFSWLPQYLFAARIPFRRVDPAHTSVTCSLCGGRGDRQGEAFTCPACHRHQNAHANAARNVLQRGQHLPARRGLS
jgi:hypothetical protein